MGGYAGYGTHIGRLCWVWYTHREAWEAYTAPTTQGVEEAQRGAFYPFPKVLGP